jgi:hypothetical protein
MLRSAAGAPSGTFNEPDEFATALRSAMTEAPNIELLFAVWEQNIATVRALSYALKQKGTDKADFAKSLVAYLRSCAVGLVNPSNEVAEADTHSKTRSEQNASSARVGVPAKD